MLFHPIELSNQELSVTDGSNTMLQSLAPQGFQSGGSIHVINLLTSGLFTANAMWTH